MHVLRRMKEKGKGSAHCEAMQFRICSMRADVLNLVSRLFSTPKVDNFKDDGGHPFAALKRHRTTHMLTFDLFRLLFWHVLTLHHAALVGR